MRIGNIIAIGALILGAAFPMGANRSAAAESAQRVLHVYTWSDYFDPEVIRIFQERHDCTVEFDYYDSNETMLSTLSQSGGYDVMTPDPPTAAILEKDGKLLRIDHKLIPNLKNLDRKTSALSEDPDMRYSVPYTATVTGIGYNRKQVGAESLGTWDIFADAKLAKRMTMLNDMREVLGAALKHLGYGLNSVNPAEVAEAGRLVGEWKPNLAMFEVDKAKEGLRDGKFAAIQAYNGDIVPIMEENPDIGFYVPSEGSSLNADDFVIAADSPLVELSHAFINHMLDPDMAAMNMESIKYYMPNPAALAKVNAKLRENAAFNVPGGILSKCEVIRSLGNATALYDAAWEKVLIGN